MEKKNTKRRVRATKEQASLMGWNPNKNGRYRVTNSEMEELSLLIERTGTDRQRQSNTERNGTPQEVFTAVKNGLMMSIDEYCEHYNLIRDNVKSYKLITHSATPYYNIQFRDVTEGDKPNSVLSDFIDNVKKYAPRYPKLPRKTSKDGHLLVIDIADLHINKYASTDFAGDNYDSGVAVKRAIEGTQGLIDKASGFNIDKILFVVGNDVLNTDNVFKQTTKGTNQDTDLHWFKAFNIAKECYVKCLELCLTVADVDVIHCASNHDLMSGSFLAVTLEAWFRNNKNITFDTSPKYRKYYKYGSSMLELEHGDKGKLANIPLIMAQEQPKMWAETKFRYALLHHFHHQDKTNWKSGKDYIGVNVTYLRSPSSADLWHYENHFINLVAVEAFVHSKDLGRVAQLTHYF
jgi:hypothetical protein